jgi:type IV secretory pathway VirB4 component
MSKPISIHLGFEVPTGTAVEIPLRHMAVCGQTQEAGKTTALEALITRAGVRALTFITKRGEASFTNRVS